MKQPKEQIILQAYKYHDGLWPRYLTSGIMDFRGTTIFQGEFNRLVKKINGKLLKKSTTMEQQNGNS